MEECSIAKMEKVERFNTKQLATGSDYLSAHFIHRIAIMPPATISETRNIAMFYHKSKLPAKKAKNSKTKASQPTPTITVPATLEPSEFMALGIAMKQLI